MVNSAVLVVNRLYVPIHVTTARRAFTLLYAGIAKAIDPQFQTFDFKSWAELSVAAHEEKMGLVGRAIRIPRVIALQTYDRIPRKHIRFSRINIFLRDKNTCQYCGRRFPKSELNIDHVIPRSRGGKTEWDNVVCSCFDCNRRKGGQTPGEAIMTLIAQPRRPPLATWGRISLRGCPYEEWRPFLNWIDASYWNVELSQE
jgi:hypothetical protein